VPSWHSENDIKKWEFLENNLTVKRKMNKNLMKHIINPIKTIKGKKVERVIYHDVFEKNSLEESKDGIHIIAQQIEFLIEEHKKLYVSWNNVDGWEQYTIACSLKSYVNESEHYEMSDHEY
jgi:hypothetical protein